MIVISIDARRATMPPTVARGVGVGVGVSEGTGVAVASAEDLQSKLAFES